MTSLARALHYGAKGDIESDAVRSVAKQYLPSVCTITKFGEDMTRGDDLCCRCVPTGAGKPFMRNILNRDAFGNRIVNEYAYRADG